MISYSRGKTKQNWEQQQQEAKGTAIDYKSQVFWDKAFPGGEEEEKVYKNVERAMTSPGDGERQQKLTTLFCALMNSGASLDHVLGTTFHIAFVYM